LLKETHEMNDLAEKIKSNMSHYPINTKRSLWSRGGMEEAKSRLQSSVASLDTEIEMKNKEMCNMIEPQAQESCRKLCGRIYRLLPRELRDNIYYFVYAHETIYVGPEYFHYTTHPCETDRDAHYWDAGYVGKEVQRELIQSWYQNTLFYFYDKRNNNEVVRKFLDMDRWQLAIKPGNFIRKVRLELDADNVHEHVPMPRISGVQPLQHLHLLPNHVSFFIRIHTYSDLMKTPRRTEDLRLTIRDLHTSLNALHAAGHKFVVKWPDYENLEFTWRDCASPVDIWIARLQA